MFIHSLISLGYSLGALLADRDHVFVESGHFSVDCWWCYFYNRIHWKYALGLSTKVKHSGKKITDKNNFL